MAESPEHFFLKTEFLNVLNDFSQTQLYHYTEGDRKKFNMSCLLTTNLERPLVGQTMWGNEAGIDKDIRMLITNPEASIWAYVLKDTVKSRSALFEIVQDFKNTTYRENLFKLKLFWVPPDFDADYEQDRIAINKLLQHSIMEDLLFNVVFGSITQQDFRYFLNEVCQSGIFGLGLALLSHVAVNGMGNFSGIHESLGVSKGPIREKYMQIRAREFIAGFGLVCNITAKGRMLLTLVKQIVESYEASNFSPELIFILPKLGERVEYQDPEGEKYIRLSPQLVNLIERFYSAKKFPGFSLDENKFINVDGYNSVNGVSLNLKT